MDTRNVISRDCCGSERIFVLYAICIQVHGRGVPSYQRSEKNNEHRMNLRFYSKQIRLIKHSIYGDVLPPICAKVLRSKDRSCRLACRPKASHFYNSLLRELFGSSATRVFRVSQTLAGGAKEVVNYLIVRRTQNVEKAEKDSSAWPQKVS